MRNYYIALRKQCIHCKLKKKERKIIFILLKSIFLFVILYRQTIVLVFYFLCLINMCIIRPLVSTACKIRGKAPIYAALYFLPLLTFLHALACGLICKNTFLKHIENPIALHIICFRYCSLLFSLFKHSHVNDLERYTLFNEIRSVL